MYCERRWLKNDLINKLLSHLTTELRFVPHKMRECTTTQGLAKNLAFKGVPEGTLVICERKSESRGRHNRSWIASSGGIWLTLVLRPSRTDKLQVLSLLSGLSIAEALERALYIKAFVKWPNDVLVKERKVAGALVDAMIGSRDSTHVLLGLGINTNNELPANLRDSAVTLAENKNALITMLSWTLSLRG